MKKLILNEAISAIMVLVVFLFAFTIFNGWAKAGQERHLIAFMAILVGILLNGIISPTVISYIIAVPGIFIAATIAAIDGAFVLAGILAVISVVSAVVFMTIKEIREINAPKKIILFSLVVEVMTMALPIFLIAFS